MCWAGEVWWARHRGPQSGWSGAALMRRCRQLAVQSLCGAASPGAAAAAAADAYLQGSCQTGRIRWYCLRHDARWRWVCAEGGSPMLLWLPPAGGCCGVCCGVAGVWPQRHAVWHPRSAAALPLPSCGTHQKQRGVGHALTGACPLSTPPSRPSSTFRPAPCFLPFILLFPAPFLLSSLPARTFATGYTRRSSSSSSMRWCGAPA